MKNKRLTIVICICGLAVACVKEPPPRTVAEFMKDSMLLEAAMVRCGQDRSSKKYEVECVNAREAINHIAKAEEVASRAELEAQSERKRRALRRTQEAAAEARRNRAEAERRRREAEYLGQFGEAPPPQDAAVSAPTIASPESDPLPDQTTSSSDQLPADIDPLTTTDLESVRQELERRQN